jgi:hypothetical protein
VMSAQALDSETAAMKTAKVEDFMQVSRNSSIRARVRA